MRALNIFEKLKFDEHVRNQEAAYIVQGSVFVKNGDYRRRLLESEERAFKGLKTRKEHYEFCKKMQAALLER